MKYHRQNKCLVVRAAKSFYSHGTSGRELHADVDVEVELDNLAAAASWNKKLLRRFLLVYFVLLFWPTFVLPPPPSSFSSKLETQNRMKTLLKEFLNFCFCFAMFVQNRRINFRVSGFFCKFLERNAVVVKMVA